MKPTAKELLLEQIASEAYNIGFTARVHFSTFDIATKLPGWITLISLAVGAMSLFLPEMGGEWLTFTLLIVGVGLLYFRYYEERLPEYEGVAKLLNENFKELRDLISAVAVMDESDAEGISRSQQRLKEIRDQARGKSISRQIFLSGWRAHYQFFWVIESEWVAKYRNPPFRFWRDKVPLSFTVLLIALAAVALVAAALWTMSVLTPCLLSVAS